MGEVYAIAQEQLRRAEAREDKIREKWLAECHKVGALEAEVRHLRAKLAEANEAVAELQAMVERAHS
jgi:hypothetical protein